jgi:hypothetical protein
MKNRLLKLFITGIGLLVVTSQANAALVSYWSFDDATANDLVGSNNGTLKNGAAFSTDTPNGSANALDLTNGKDYVLLPSTDFGIGATSSFTISAWAKYTSSERGVITIMQDLTSGGGDRSGVTFGMGGDTNLFVGIIASSGGDDAVNGGATFRDIVVDQAVPTGEWVHIAAVLGNDALTTYLNGVPAASYAVNPAGSTMQADGTLVTGGAGLDFNDANGSFTGFGASGNAPAVGDSPGDFTRLFYEGLLDDVAIWDSALSSAEIEALAAGGAVPGGVPAVPTVSEWGLIIMALLILTAGTVVICRKRRTVSG